MGSGIESPTMAKKAEKGKKKQDSTGPRDAVRGAVESTFMAAAGGASRAQELLEEISSQLRGLRDANLVGTLEGLRDDVQTLAKRVASLEIRGNDAPKPSPTRRPSTSATRTTAAKKPAARKPAAAKKATTAAKKTTTAAKKTTTAAKKTTTAAKKPTTAAKKPAARKPAARKPATSRTTKSS